MVWCRKASGRNNAALLAWGGGLRHIIKVEVLEMACCVGIERPKVLYVDTICDEAISILAEVADIYPANIFYPSCCDIIWTGLTPVDFPQGTVASPCTGIDHIKAKEVLYLDNMWKLTQGRMVTSTAEHAFSLILRLAKRRKMQLYGKTLGIIGYGRIGSLVARYGRAFNMHPIIFDKLDIKDLCPFPQVSLKELLKKSDVISIHLPLDEITRDFISDKELYEMKDGVILVNTSRPQIIDERALVLYIDKLGGFGDDFYDYHMKFGHMKFGMERKFLFKNFLSSAHIGGNCTEARIATDVYIANKVKDYITDKECCER
jgi:phosphoglycerate dehydrogenase-like enzyme